MNYTKLTLEAFSKRLKAGEYDSIAGARRAVGRTDWKENDKDSGRALINKYFGVAAGDVPAAKKGATKKAAKGAKTKSAGVKVAATTKKPKAPKSAPAATPKRRGRPPKATSAGPASPASAPILEEVTRQHSASNVISAFRNSGQLSDTEKRAYDIATIEYAENASQVARSMYDTARTGIPVPPPMSSGEVVVPEGTRPRIADAQPNGATGLVGDPS